MAELAKTFAYHKPSAEGVVRIEKIRAAFGRLHDELLHLSPNPTRERSIGITHLETAAMFFTKDVTHNDPDSTIAEPVTS